jgi:hypothetical protein
MDEALGGMNVAAFVCMVAVEVVGLAANCLVLLIVLATAVLRDNTTYVLVLSLAFTELLATLTVLPLALAAYHAQAWPLGDALCALQGFLETFCMSMSIFSLCAISIERFYFIKWPMHYAAHMSMSKAVGAMLAVAALALLLALCPLLGWSEYAFDHLKSTCTFRHDAGFLVTVGVMCFVLPGGVMMTMYYGIYRVAKQSACQVQPSIALASHTAVNPSCEMDRDSGVPSTDGNLSDPGDEEPEDASGHGHSHWKAIRTLVTIVTFFLALWGPYFVLCFMTATGHVPAHSAYVASTWLGFTSYAVNPFVYGFLNRNIREAMAALYERLKQGTAGTRDSAQHDDDDIAAADNEDFFQFLERTSSVPNETLQVLDVKALPVLMRTHDTPPPHTHGPH